MCLLVSGIYTRTQDSCMRLLSSDNSQLLISCPVCADAVHTYTSVVLTYRHLSRTPSNTLNQRPVWKQPCKVPAPQSYSLQWQHIDLSQLEAFPSTLRGTGSPLPSRKRDQPDFTYNAPERPLDRIAAVTARTPTPHAQQQRTHALSHAGNHLATGTHESERTAEGMHSSPVKADRKADASSIMQHCTGSYARQSGLHHTHVINCLSDANGKLAQCQHATPAQPSSPALQPSLRRQKAAQHADTCSAKQSAAGCSHDSQTVKDITPTHSHKVQASTRRSGHEGKHDPMHAGTQSSCSQRYDPVGRSPGRGSCTPQRKAHEGSEGLQRQDTLLGNWVRWEKAAGAPVVSSPGHPQHKVRMLAA